MGGDQLFLGRASRLAGGSARHWNRARTGARFHVGRGLQELYRDVAKYAVALVGDEMREIARSESHISIFQYQRDGFLSYPGIDEVRVSQGYKCIVIPVPMHQR